MKTSLLFSVAAALALSACSGGDNAADADTADTATATDTGADAEATTAAAEGAMTTNPQGFVDTAAASERVRRLLDADCDPRAVDDHLAADPVLGDLVRATPGLRVPGQVDGEIGQRSEGETGAKPGADAPAGGQDGRRVGGHVMTVGADSAPDQPDRRAACPSATSKVRHLTSSP